MKKKLIPLILVLVCAIACAFGLAACNEDKKTDSGNNGGKPSETIAVERIELSQTDFTLEIGQQNTLIATVYPQNATSKNVAWNSSDKKIATVSNGVVAAQSVGNVTITASVGDAKAECSVTVREAVKPAVPVEIILLNETILNLSVGDEETLTATIKPENATNKTVTWSVSPVGIVTVNNGKLTADAEGTATITATAGGKTATCAVTVEEVVQGTEGLTFTNYAVDTLSVSGIGTATDTEIIIPSKHEGKPVVAIGYDAFAGCNSITSITIPDSVTTISDGAFYNCTSLTSITIPDSVTTIGDSVFYECTSLTSITIPDSVTTISSSMFNYCTSLTSIMLPDSITSIGDDAFAWCTSLTNITIPDGVITIGGSAFVYCTSLASITIPQSVTTIGEGAFAECDSLERINLPDIAALCELEREYWGDYDIYIDGELLQGGVIIPDGVKSVKSNAFRGMTGITSVIIPESVTAIGDDAFAWCTSLTNITIPDSVTSIGDCAFQGCSSLTSIIIPDDVTSIGVGTFDECRSLISISIPDSVTSIGTSAFANCYNLEDVTLGNSLKTIGMYAFSDTSLISIVIPESVTTIEDFAFYNCSSLSTLALNEGLQSLGIISMLNALTSLNIPSTVTQIGDIMSCAKLSEITFPEGLDTSHITFASCPKYKGTLKGNVFVKGSKLEGVKDDAISVIIPSDVTTIGANVFESVASLKYIYIPSSVTTAENNAFAGCEDVIRFYEGNSTPGSNFNNKFYNNIGSCTSDGWIYDVSGSNISIRAYIGVGGEVTVPAQIDGKAVATLSQEGGVGNVFLERVDITKITFTSESLTVEAGTLASLTNLKEIALSEGVAGVSMSKAAYEGCTDLTAISLAGGYDNYQIILVTFTSGGMPSGTTTLDVSDGADVLVKLNNASELTVCMIALKGQN